MWVYRYGRSQSDRHEPASPGVAIARGSDERRDEWLQPPSPLVVQTVVEAAAERAAHRVDAFRFIAVRLACQPCDGLHEAHAFIRAPVRSIFPPQAPELVRAPPEPRLATCLSHHCDLPCVQGSATTLRARANSSVYVLSHGPRASHAKAHG